VLVLLVAGTIYFTFSGRQDIPERAELSGLTIVKDGIVSFAVLPIGPAEVALVDAGNDPHAAAIRAELTRRHLTPDAVKAILLTHGHGDHIAGTTEFPKADVYALAADVALAEGREGPKGLLGMLMPAHLTGIKVTHVLQNQEELTLGADRLKVTVFTVPGHTAGSAAYLVKDVVFLGDSADITSEGELIGAPWLFSEDQRQNRNSLFYLYRQLASRRETEPVSTLVCAHSGALARGIEPLRAFAGLATH